MQVVAIVIYDIGVKKNCRRCSVFRRWQLLKLCVSVFICSMCAWLFKLWAGSNHFQGVLVIMQSTVQWSRCWGP